jgi:hypothetical protein
MELKTITDSLSPPIKRIQAVAWWSFPSGIFSWLYYNDEFPHLEDELFSLFYTPTQPQDGLCMPREM